MLKFQVLYGCKCRSCVQVQMFKFCVLHESKCKMPKFHVLYERKCSSCVLCLSVCFVRVRRCFRINLMQLVVSKIAQNILPSSSEHKQQSPHVLPLTKPVKEMLRETWRETFEKGCITNDDLLKFDQLLKVVGPGFFCQTLLIVS